MYIVHLCSYFVGPALFCITRLKSNVHCITAQMRSLIFWQFTCMCTCLLSQQDELLSELRECARSDPLPDDAPSVELVISYLESL